MVHERLQFKPHPEGDFEDDLSQLIELWSMRLFETGNRLYVYEKSLQKVEVWVLENRLNWLWAKTLRVCDLPDDIKRYSSLVAASPLANEDGELAYLRPRVGVIRTNSRSKRQQILGGKKKKDSLSSLCMVNWRPSLVSFKHYLRIFESSIIASFPHKFTAARPELTNKMEL